MASLIKLLVLALTLVGQTGAAYSDDFKEFLTLVNGDFTNSDQTKEKDNDHDLVQVQFRHVKIPSVKKGQPIYCVETINGINYREEINVATQDKNGAIKVTPYNLSDTSIYRDGNYTFDDLSNLQREDFKHTKGCAMFFKKVAPAVFTGTRPDCRNKIKGKYENYFLTFTCTSFMGVPPLTAKEAPTTLPYQLNLQGSRFPALIAVPDLCK